MKSILTSLILISSFISNAQVKWDCQIKDSVKITAIISPGWRLYSQDEQPEARSTTFKVNKQPVTMIENGNKQKDSLGNQYFTGIVYFSTLSNAAIVVSVIYQPCTTDTCAVIKNLVFK